MRQRFPVRLTAGQRWPDAQQGQRLPRFNWLKVENKGSQPADVALSSNPAAGDPLDTLFTVPGGGMRIYNVAGTSDGGDDDPSNSWCEEIHIVSSNGTVLWIEISDHPIYDSFSQTSQGTRVTAYRAALTDGNAHDLLTPAASAGNHWEILHIHVSNWHPTTDAGLTLTDGTTPWESFCAHAGGGADADYSGDPIRFATATKITAQASASADLRVHVQARTVPD